MTIDKTTLKSNLQIKVDTASNNTIGTEDVLSLALSAWALNDVNVVTVQSIDFLPNLEVYSGSTELECIVCFIVSSGIYVISSNKKWITLDGKLIRDDTGTALGFAFSWGCNSSFELGDTTNITRSSPVSVVGGFNDWRQLSAGCRFGTGVKNNGTMWAWGINAAAQLGDGTFITRSSPISVLGGFTDWCQVSAGCIHTVAVRSNGTAWAWGCNGYGRLGDNTAINKSSPVSVVGGYTDWCQVSAGAGHSLGVRTNGTAWAWGLNNTGQLGDNTIINKSSPITVIGGFTDWCQVSAGSNHSLGVRQNGTAWGWGWNNCGQLGDLSYTSRRSPVSVVGGFTDWCQVNAGINHSLGVRTNGTAWGWGDGCAGKLGDNAVTTRLSPVLVVGGFTDWCQVSAGEQHSLGIRTNGTAWAWGYNTPGTLGNNTNISSRSPVSVVGGFTDWSQVSGGGRGFSLGLRKIC